MESSSFWNPESTVLESGIQYPESGIHSMESRIQDCPGFPYMGRERVPIVSRMSVNLIKRAISQATSEKEYLFNLTFSGLKGC